MAEKHGNALDQPDLDEHEAESNQQEIAAADQRQLSVDLANGRPRRQDDDVRNDDGRQENDQEKRGDGDQVAVPTGSRIKDLAVSPFTQREVDLGRMGKAKLIEEER